MIKVDVISGFLGAGKTTLIKKLFEGQYRNEKIALIENEFGEIGIDGAFLKGSGIEIKEINSGCICCSLVGDFASSIKELVDKYNPDRIVIEPSGVGKLSDILRAVKGVKEQLELNIIATVVDGGKCKMYMKNFGEFYLDQIKEANTIVVSKGDKISADKLLECVDILKAINDHATIITTPVVELNSETLCQVLEKDKGGIESLIAELMHDEDDDDEECCCHHHHHHDDDDEDEDEHHHHNGECCHHHDDDDDEHEHHHHHDGECCCHHHEGEGHHHEHHHHDADEVFASWGIETAKSYTEDELRNILADLTKADKYGIVLRAKGILSSTDKNGWLYFDYVAGDFDIRRGNADYTGRVCVIGSHIVKENIEELFKKG